MNSICTHVSYCLGDMKGAFEFYNDAVSTSSHTTGNGIFVGCISYVCFIPPFTHRHIAPTSFGKATDYLLYQPCSRKD